MFRTLVDDYRQSGPIELGFAWAGAMTRKKIFSKADLLGRAIGQSPETLVKISSNHHRFCSKLIRFTKGIPSIGH